MKVTPYQIDQFIENIHKNNNIFAALVYGPESGLISIRSNKISKKIVDNLADPFLVINLSAEKISNDSALLADEFFSIPMLGGRKLIIADGSESKIIESLKLIFDGGKNLQNCDFILIPSSDLDRNSSLRKFCETNINIAAIPCYEDDQATISQIIKQKLREHNLTAEDGVIELILEKHGKNRLIIFGELEKLALFCGKNSEQKNIVTLEIAEKVISDISQISAGEFLNHFADLNLKNSINSLDKLLEEKFNVITLIRFLANYFSKLQISRIKIDNGVSIEEEIKSQKLFFKQEVFFRKHLNQWRLKALNEVLIKLQELEVRCKSINYNSEVTLRSFVNYVYLKHKIRDGLM